MSEKNNTPVIAGVTVAVVALAAVGWVLASNMIGTDDATAIRLCKYAVESYSRGGVQQFKEAAMMQNVGPNEIGVTVTFNSPRGPGFADCTFDTDRLEQSPDLRAFSVNGVTIAGIDFDLLHTNVALKGAYR